jgi:L-lactate dehydrogenase complex protein LldE
MTERVGLFVTCLADTLYPEVGKATVAVLERLGIEVDFPAEQTCCGQMHANSGYPAEAELLARRFVEIFEPYEAVVTPSGSCAAHVREHYPHLLGGDAGDVPMRTWELSQFLTGVAGIVDLGSAFEGTVTYHPTCHSLRLLRVGDAPTRLLDAVAGLELVELPDAEECCGFGGTFAVKFGEISSRLADNKCQHIVTNGAETVVLGDLGCMLNIEGRLRRRGDATRVMHVAEVLAGDLPPGA